MNERKLFRIHLANDPLFRGIGPIYVVASSFDSAGDMVRAYVKKQDYLDKFYIERIEVIAEERQIKGEMDLLFVEEKKDE